MKKIPVHIICGFLGSGKTTAIIKLLDQKANDEKWAVIINEFGKTSIDSQTLRSSSDAGTVFEVSGGCICCSAQGYFQENLEKIIQSGDYSRIIIEPSGLGGIEMVSEIVNVNPNLELMPVICLVDMTCIENSRLQLNPIYRMQITKADVIIFSKCDLVIDETEQLLLIEKFKSSFPNKRDCILIGTNLWFSLLDADIPGNTRSDTYRMISAENPNLSDSNYQEKTSLFGSDTIFDTRRVIRFFNDHPSIIRAKGHIRSEKGWKLFNFTLSGYLFEACQEKEQNEIIFISEKSDASWLHNLDEQFGKTKYRIKKE